MLVKLEMLDDHTALQQRLMRVAIDKIVGLSFEQYTSLLVDGRVKIAEPPTLAEANQMGLPQLTSILRHCPLAETFG